MSSSLSSWVTSLCVAAQKRFLIEITLPELASLESRCEADFVVSTRHLKYIFFFPV